MAESRRVEFTTLSCDSPSSSSSSSSSTSSSSSSSDLQVQKSPSGSVLQADGTRPDRTTVRLVLSLFESDESRFPEFSFTQLTQNKLKRSKVEGPLFTSEQKEKRETDDVAAIARKLEEKYLYFLYSPKPNKKEDRIQDLIDIGFGYDDEDSFIDNSEAYDEFVPASITTKFGGFYVNSGVLQFRPASDTETIDLTTEDTSKKRKLHGGQDKPKKKPCREDGEMKSNVDSKSSTLSEIGPDNEMKQRKKKKGVCTLSVTSMLKKFQREKEKKRQKLVKGKQRAAGVTGLPTIPRCPADAAGGGGSGLADPLLSLIGSTNDHVLIQAASTVDFDIDLVSLLDSEETLSSVPQPATETQLFQPTINDHTQFTVPQPPNTKTHFQPKTHPEQIQLLSEAGSSQLCPPLPEGLPPALEDSVRTLMTVVKISEGESKLKFFTPEINSILLEIELQCRGQTGQLRSRFVHTPVVFLPCSRETLLKRVKKLLLAHMEEPPDMDDPLQKLKEAIAKAMPEQIASYRTNCQAYEQVKTSKTTEDGSEVNQSVHVAPEDSVKRGGPKKLFKWNEEIRECLCHVLRLKMDRYEKERNGNQEVEEFLKTLLDNEVKPLWPKGWMQTRALIRESRKLLGFFPSLPGKKTRPDKKQSSTAVPPQCRTFSRELHH
ncbi:ubinuclein-1-like isoform X1 [Hippoglossus hippoglossus]|uniref:ubinuclein-1-like isoform X1 n=1 Tax=Hippoglossus hippoglossus TaxID=8267 RepID=UPI00148DADE3|nr:ubinuclein-1-like isoform X1 [Hippoglossus hippoglossus]